jgi:hypothetical protein
MLLAGEALFIAATPIVDTSKEPAKEVVLCANEQSKGLMASDGRAYLLDITRVAPRDLNFGDLEYDGARSVPEICT